MNRYTLVPVDYQPDFSDYSLVPVDYDPFSGDDGTGIGGKDLAQADGFLPSGPQQPLAYLPQAPQPQPVQPPQPQAGPQQSARSQPPISLPERTVLGAGAPTVPISGLDESSPANRQQPGRVPSPQSAGGDSPTPWPSLLQDGINAAVPGAYYGDLAYQHLRKGNYGLAAGYEAAGLADAALALLPFGALARSEMAAARPAIVAVPPSIDTASTNVLYKLETYLLDQTLSKDAAAKADWFKRALGFTQENAGDLAKQLVFDETKAVKTWVSPYGTHFNQVINVTGANGRTIPIRTAWRVGPDGTPRFVTALPRS